MSPPNSPRSADGTDDSKATSGSSEQPVATKKARMTKIEEEEQVYCICRKAHSKSFMIQCDACKEWFHGNCVNILEDDAKHIRRYHCDSCCSQSSNLQRIVYHKRYIEQMERERRDAELMAALRCGQCIGCYRTEICAKCPGCLSEPRTDCHKMRCIKADATIMAQSNRRAVGRPRRDRKSCDDSDGTGPGSPPTPASIPRPPIGGEPGGTEKRKRGRKKGWKKDAQNANFTSKDDSEDDKKPFDENATKARTYIEAAYHVGNYGGKIELQIKQCQGYQCINAATEGSKYCSYECGINLAKRRLQSILPGRLHEYWSKTSSADERARRQLREYDLTLNDYDSRIDQLLNQLTIIYGYIEAMQAQKYSEGASNKKNEDASETQEADEGLATCYICGLEIGSKTLAKHVERCYVRVEKQVTYEAPLKEPPHRSNKDLVCDHHDKKRDTYCKRLRIICADHYKADVENKLEICAFPLVFSQGTIRWADVKLTFEFLTSKQVCWNARKECTAHHKWFQQVVATIDSERLDLVKQATRINEAKTLLGETLRMRGDVLSLLMTSSRERKRSSAVQS